MLLDSVGQCCTGSGLFFFSRGFLLILIGLCWPGSAGQRTSFSLVTSLVIPKASFHCINRFTPRERRNSQDSAFISLWSIDSFHPSSTTHTGIRREGTCRADSCIAKTLGHWAGLTGTVRLLHPAKRERKAHSCTFDVLHVHLATPTRRHWDPKHLQQKNRTDHWIGDPSIGVLGDRLETAGGGKSKIRRFPFCHSSSS